MLLRLTALCAGAFMAITFSDFASAQEAPASQFDHVKGLEPLVGAWKGTVTEPDGTEVQVKLNCSWAANKSYAKIDIMVQPGDESMHMGTLMVGRDPGNDGLRMWGFWPDSVATGEAKVENGTLRYTGHGQLFDGGTSSADVTFKASGGELNVNVTNSKRNDEEQPDMSVTLERQQPRKQ